MAPPTALHDAPLAASDRGGVERCPCCGDLDLRFDGVGVTLTPGQLRQMQRTLVAVRAGGGTPWGWALRAETARETAVFRLPGVDDADALGELLDAAVAVLDLDALLLGTLGPRPAA